MSAYTDLMATLRTYDQLDPAAQAVALEHMRADWQNAYRRDVTTARALVGTASIHDRLLHNAFGRVRGLAHRLGHLRRLLTNDAALADNTRANLCMFRPDGTYHRFMPARK